MARRNQYGEWGEWVAAEYLRKKGYVILDRNWETLEGNEIDIIARKDDTLVVVEVKTRHDERWEKAKEVVKPEQQENIIRATRSYMSFRRLSLKVRIDLITVVGLPPSPQIEHIENVVQNLW